LQNYLRKGIGEDYYVPFRSPQKSIGRRSKKVIGWGLRALIGVKPRN